MIASERFGAQPGSAAPGPIFCHGWDPTFYFGFDFGWENRHLKKCHVASFLVTDLTSSEFGSPFDVKKFHRLAGGLCR